MNRSRDLSSEYKVTKLLLQTEFPSYNLTSKRKSTKIQSASVQIPKAFNMHGIAAKTKKIFRFEHGDINGINALI